MGASRREFPSEFEELGRASGRRTDNSSRPAKMRHPLSDLQGSQHVGEPSRGGESLSGNTEVGGSQPWGGCCGQPMAVNLV